MPKLILLLGLTTNLVACVAAQSKNGFDLDEALVPAAEIYSGGPPKDGIPALDQPKFIAAGEAEFLKDSDAILGLANNGMAKAYPIKILNWHEIVNDHFVGEPILVSFCPLCGSGMVHSARIGEKHLQFGVSGLLYNSDVLMYDRETESLWSQLMSQAVSGPLKGQKLFALPVLHTTWKDWRTRYPNSKVLAIDTGYNRDYSADPYRNYPSDETIWFPVNNTSAQFRPKELVLGIEVRGEFKAYPFRELAKGPKEITDMLANKKIVVRFNQTHNSAALYDANDHALPSVTTYWFAWYTFHPETKIFLSDTP